MVLVMRFRDDEYNSSLGHTIEYSNKSLFDIQRSGCTNRQNEDCSEWKYLFVLSSKGTAIVGLGFQGNHKI